MSAAGTTSGHEAALRELLDKQAIREVSMRYCRGVDRGDAELISSAKTISQFLDRDSRPDFASPVVIPALQQFLKDGDSASVTKSLESQAKTIFTS